MSREPRPPSSEPAIRIRMMPPDTNPSGGIFGGVVLSLIDQAVFVEALRQSNHRYVTASVKEVQFHKPLHLGDLVSIYCETTRMGRSSLTIHARVTCNPRREPEKVEHVADADVVVVAVDDHHNPEPIFDSPE